MIKLNGPLNYHSCNKLPEAIVIVLFLGISTRPTRHPHVLVKSRWSPCVLSENCLDQGADTRLSVRASWEKEPRMPRKYRTRASRLTCNRMPDAYEDWDFFMGIYYELYVLIWMCMCIQGYYIYIYTYFHLLIYFIYFCWYIHICHYLCLQIFLRLYDMCVYAYRHCCT